MQQSSLLSEEKQSAKVNAFEQFYEVLNACQWRNTNVGGQCPPCGLVRWAVLLDCVSIHVLHAGISGNCVSLGTKFMLLDCAQANQTV